MEENCLSCKYNSKSISVWKNWCCEPTFPSKIIVYSTGTCNRYKGGTVQTTYQKNYSVLPKREKWDWKPKSIKPRKHLDSKLKLNEGKTKEFLKKFFPEAAD